MPTTLELLKNRSHLFLAIATVHLYDNGYLSLPEAATFEEQFALLVRQIADNPSFLLQQAVRYHAAREAGQIRSNPLLDFALDQISSQPLVEEKRPLFFKAINLEQDTCIKNRYAGHYDFYCERRALQFQNALPPAMAVAGTWLMSPQGIDLYVREAGDPTKPPLLFIPGGFQSLACWKHQRTDPLLARHHHLLFFDPPGLGLSGPWDRQEIDPSATTGDILADGLRAVVEHYHLHERGFVPVAWSFAGVTIRNYLLKYGNQGIRGLALVGSLLDFSFLAPLSSDLFSPKAKETLEGLMRALAEGKANPDLAPLFAFLELLRAIPPDEEEYDQIVGYNVRAWRRAHLLPFATAHLPGDPLPLVRQLPVQFLQGKYDELVPLKLAHSLAAQLPDATMHVFEHSGHAPFAEEPQRFNSELASFVRPLWHE